MTQYRHRGTSDPTKPFPTLEPREISVNTANRQLVAGDAQSGLSGTPLALIAVRFFDTRAQYAAGDMVINTGKLLRAKASIPPGVFNIAQWDEVINDLKPYIDNALANKSSVIVSDTAPTGVIDNTLWWSSTLGKLMVRYNDGSGPAQWVEAVAQPVPDMSWAAPVDAIAFSGMQINGSMDISQENGSGTNVSVTSGGKNIVDGWLLFAYGAATVFANQTSGISGFPGFANFLGMGVATAMPAPTSGDLVMFTQNVEGTRVSRLGWGTASAQPVTIAFWTAHQRAGIYSVSIRRKPNYDRSYVTTYTQASAGVPQYNVITIPGDTAGPWVINNLGAWDLGFAVASGTGLTTATSNAWIAGNFIAATGQVNGVATTSEAFRLTGVVVLPGVMAPTAAQSSRIMRPYDQELLTCMRYYQRIGTEFSGRAVNATVAICSAQFRQTMRAIPTTALIAASAPSGLACPGVLAITPTGIDVVQAASTGAISMGFTVGAGTMTAGQIIIGLTDGWLQLDARL